MSFSRAASQVYRREIGRSLPGASPRASVVSVPERKSSAVPPEKQEFNEFAGRAKSDRQTPPIDCALAEDPDVCRDFKEALGEISEIMGADAVQCVAQWDRVFVGQLERATVKLDAFTNAIGKLDATSERVLETLRNVIAGGYEKIDDLRDDFVDTSRFMLTVQVPGKKEATLDQVLRTTHSRKEMAELAAALRADATQQQLKKLMTVMCNSIHVAIRHMWREFNTYLLHGQKVIDEALVRYNSQRSWKVSRLWRGKPLAGGDYVLRLESNVPGSDLDPRDSYVGETDRERISHTLGDLGRERRASDRRARSLQQLQQQRASSVRPRLASHVRSFVRREETV